MTRKSLCTAVLAAALALAPATASAATWAVQAPVDPAGSAATSFSSVACPASTTCVAVGRWDGGGGAPTALAEGMATSTWSTQTLATPSGSLSTDLYGVACTAVRECTAVGNYENGAGVQQPLIERYTGSWALQTAPAPSGAQATYLTGVSCTSSTLCTAVGSSVDALGVQSTFALRWASGSWTIQTTPNPSGYQSASLTGVSCTTSTACTAVGSYVDSGGVTQSLAIGWNGTRWTTQATPSVSGATGVSLASVSCSSSTACTAVGNSYNASFVYSQVAMRWNGSTWSLQTIAGPSGSAGAALSGVFCTSSTHCSAAGYSYTSLGVVSSLAQIWNGTTWTVQTTPSPSGSTGSNLAGIWCRTSTECSAVGHWFDASSVQKALALRYL